MPTLFIDMVKEDLKKFSESFNLTDIDLNIAFNLVDKIGWQPARPSSIAIAIIKILKPNIPNVEIYKKADTEYNTIKKWVEILCEELNIKQTYFK